VRGSAVDSALVAAGLEHDMMKAPHAAAAIEMSHSKRFFSFVSDIAAKIPFDKIDALTRALVSLRERGGRLFLLGVGGSAGNCSHAVNDFRKLCGIEAYSPVDNMSELSARANDEGWDTVFSGWLAVSRLCEKDAILVFSVGGGDAERNISTNIVKAVDFAKSRSAAVLGIVGRSSGYTAKHGDIVVVIPEVAPALLTPLSEAYQAVVWHCLVSHPLLQLQKTKW
jgi:D-sedoheptulose 7-phosphate isomerase